MPAGVDLPLRCQCGAFEGVLKDAKPSAGIRVICYCDDCQAYAHHLGRAHDALDENAGSDSFVVAPAQVKILRGADQIKCLRLTAKGLNRFYAGCCQTPIANSVSTSKFAFAAVPTLIMDFENPPADADKVIGRLTNGVQARFAIGTPPTWASSRVAPLFLMKAMKFAVTTLLRGTAHPSPFFNETSRPRVKPYVLTHDERELLRPLCGPNPHDQPAY